MHPNTTKRNRTWVQGPMGWIGCVFVKTSNATLWHELLHYLHQFSPFCIEFTVVTKHSQMHQNTMKRTKTWGYGPMGWIGCARCEKLQRDFVAWTFALIAPVQPVLHRVNCCNRTIPNAPEHYETRQNKSLGSYGWIGCARCEKLRRGLVSWTFTLIAPVQPILHRVYCRNETIPNAPELYEMRQNMSLGILWVGSGVLVVKSSDASSWHELLL